MPRILVDADACPVKEEVYRVALRRNSPVVIVANSRLRVPDHPLVTREVVSDGFDAADDRIAELSGPNTLVVTADILLAEQCLRQSAIVLAPTGRPFTAVSIGGAVATRSLMADLRVGGDVVSGPPPFTRADRSRFLQALDRELVRLERR